MREDATLRIEKRRDRRNPSDMRRRKHFVKILKKYTRTSFGASNNKANGVDWKLHDGGLTKINDVHLGASDKCIDCKVESAQPKNLAKMPYSRDGQVVKLPQIAARERGPGPTRYMLKTLCRSNGHDITKPRNPAYSLGPRLQPIKSFNSPGPCHLPARDQPGTRRNP